MTEALTTPKKSSWLLIVAAAAIFVASVVILPLTGHGLVSASADGGIGRQLWMLLLPPVAGIVLALAIPPRAPATTAVVGPRSTISRRSWLLVGLAVLFPLMVGIGSLGDSILYMALKVVLFIVVPLVAFRFMRDGVTQPQLLPRTRWQWLAPVPVIVAWAVLAYATPLAPAVPTLKDYPDPAFVAVVAFLTFLTASVGEEVFYRYFLQSHLEAWLGRWAAIAVSALLFALMHVPTHGSGAAWVIVATAVALQGVTGVFLGVLWARYRNLWANIAVHGMLNGVGVVLYFISLG